MSQTDRPSITLTTEDVSELSNEWAQFLIDNTPEPKKPGEFTTSDYVALMAKRGQVISEMTAGRWLAALENKKKLTSRRVGVYRYYRKVDQA